MGNARERHMGLAARARGTWASPGAVPRAPPAHACVWRGDRA